MYKASWNLTILVFLCAGLAIFKTDFIMLNIFLLLFQGNSLKQRWKWMVILYSWVFILWPARIKWAHTRKPILWSVRFLFCVILLRCRDYRWLECGGVRWFLKIEQPCMSRTDITMIYTSDSFPVSPGITEPSLITVLYHSVSLYFSKLAFQVFIDFGVTL